LFIQEAQTVIWGMQHLGVMIYHGIQLLFSAIQGNRLKAVPAGIEILLLNVGGGKMLRYTNVSAYG